MMKEAPSAAIVTFAYGIHKTTKINFCVNANMLWSAEGLVDLFNQTREAHLGEETEENQDDWQTWHLDSVQEATDYYLLEEQENTNSL